MVWCVKAPIPYTTGVAGAGAGVAAAGTGAGTEGLGEAEGVGVDGEGPVSTEVPVVAGAPSLRDRVMYTRPLTSRLRALPRQASHSRNV